MWHLIRIYIVCHTYSNMVCSKVHFIRLQVIWISRRLPNRHTTLKQRRFNVVESTLFQRCVPAGWIHMVHFLPFFIWATTFWLPLYYHLHQALSEEWFILKNKEYLLPLDANVFLLGQTPFPNGGQNKFDRTASLKNSPKRQTS